MQYSQRAEQHRQKANELLREHRKDLDDKILTEFRGIVDGVDVRDIEEFDPFHWILEFAEVYATGGFDVIVGNPPWEVLSSNREEFFSRYDAEFRTRPLDEKDEIQDELLGDDDIAERWEAHKERIDILATYFRDSDSYQLQSPDVGGQAKTDLAMLFLERVCEITDEGGYVAKLFPGKLFTGVGNKDLRTYLLSETSVDCIIGFENKGGRIFDEVHNQYRFGIVSFQDDGETEELRVRFRNFDLDILQDVDGKTFPISAQILRDYAPETRIFPTISQPEVIPILEKSIQHPAIGERREGEWYIDLYKEELNRSRDKDRFVDDKSEGNYPVYGGSNIWQFNYDNTIWSDIESPSFWSVDEDRDPETSAKRRIREKQVGRLKKALFKEFDGSGSQIGFVNDLLEGHRGKSLSEEDVLLDCTEYRIAIREIANKANERTCLGAVIPQGVVCHHKAPNIRPYKISPDEDDLDEFPLHSVYERIFTDEELFAVLGLLNSLPFDYLIRMKLDDTLGATMFEECQAPHLTAGDDWFEYIWQRAAKLNCYGDKFEEIRERLGITATTDIQERRGLRAELEAAAFYTYGFDRDEVKFIIEDFEKVQSPRIMDDAYYTMVLDKYDNIN